MREPEEHIFEQGDSWFHRPWDVVARWVRRNDRSSAMILSVIVVALIASTAGSPTSTSPIEHSSPTPNPLPSAGQRLVGTGPFLVWSWTTPDTKKTFIYAQDISLSGPTKQIPLGSVDGTITGQAFALSGFALSSIAVQAGTAQPYMIGRGGIQIVRSPLEETRQFLVSPETGDQAFLGPSSAGQQYKITVVHRGSVSRLISFEVPRSLGNGFPGAQFQPAIDNWYERGGLFLVSFSCGCDAQVAPYTLTSDGKLASADWLGNEFLGGYSTRDGSRVTFIQPSGCPQQPNELDCPLGVGLADLRLGRVKTIRRSAGVQGGLIVSPQEDLVAYSRIGARLDIVRISDGGVEGEAGYESASLTPVAWVDESHIVAEADSPDLLTGAYTQQFVLITLPPQENPPPQVLVQGSGLQYLGLLR
jgi:hypothetical protein